MRSFFYESVRKSLSPEWGRILWNLTFWLPLIFILRMALPLFSLGNHAVNSIYHFCNAQLPIICFETVQVALFLFGMSIIWLLQVGFSFMHFLFSIPCYAFKLNNQPGGRSIFEIISNPRNSEQNAKKPQAKPIKRKILQQYHKKEKKNIPKMLSQLNIFTCYQTSSAWKHRDADVGSELIPC